MNILLGSYTVTIPDFFAMLGGQTIPGASFIVMENKFPQAVLGLLAGASFGVAGAIFQSMLRNPLASPDIIGISYGASATAVAAVVVFGVRVRASRCGDRRGPAVRPARPALPPPGPRPRRHRADPHRHWRRRLHAGAVTFLLSRADINNAQDVMVWLTGSLNSANWERVAILAVALLLLLPAARRSREPRALALGDDTAAGLGFNVRAPALLTIGVFWRRSPRPPPDP